MLVMFLVLLVYLSVGTALSRKDYARRSLGHKSRDHSTEIAAKKSTLKYMQHRSDCWRGPTYRSTDRDCDCNKKQEWKKLHREIGELQEGHVPLRGPYHMVFGWPAIGYHAFLTGGTIKPQQLSNAEYVKQLEQLNEIAGTDD